MSKKTIITAFPTFLRPYRWQALRGYRRLPVVFLLDLVAMTGLAQMKVTGHVVNERGEGVEAFIQSDSHEVRHARG